MASKLTFSFHSHTHNSITKSIAVTFATLQVASLFLYSADFLAYFASPCIHGCRRVSSLHHFPLILSFFRLAAAAAFAVILFVIHFFFARSVVKQMRSCRRQFYSRSIVEAELFKLRLLHAFGCVSGCVLQSMFAAYFLFGPAMVPLSLSWSKCAPHPLANLNRTLIPVWHDLAPHALFAVFSGIAYAMLLYAVGAHVTRSYPFHVKVINRVFLYLPRVFLMSAIPTLLAAVPAAFLHYFLAESPLLIIPEAGTWPRLLEWWASVFAALWTSFAALLSWNVIAVLEEQFLGPDRSLAVEVGRARLHRDLGELIHTESARLMDLVQNGASPKLYDDDDAFTSREVLTCLSLLTMPAVNMSEFPVFVDASGETWRITLSHCLAPLDFLQESLREYNVSRFQKSSLRGSTALFRGPSRSTMPPSALSFLSGSSSFVFADADMCITSSRVLSLLFVMSYDIDTYGVVHRTLVQTVHSLLMCKEQTERFLAIREVSGHDGRGAGGLFDGTGVARKLGDMMQYSSDYETVAAIDDAIKLAMYRIIGTFHTHMYNFVDGNEVTWDRSLDRQLRDFLAYQTS